MEPRRLCVYDAQKDAEIWIDLDEHDIDEAQAIIAEALNCENDFTIYKHEGFGEFAIESLEDAYDLHDALQCDLPDDLKTPEFFDGYRSYSSAVETLQDRYQGTYETKEDYAESFLRDTGAFDGVSKALIQYFDFESYARDLELGGDVDFVDCYDGYIVLTNE
jgi:hypothetical protein